MLLLLPILVPLIGGIFVFRQKNETYRDWLVDRDYRRDGAG